MFSPFKPWKKNISNNNLKAKSKKGILLKFIAEGINEICLEYSSRVSEHKTQLSRVSANIK